MLGDDPAPRAPKNIADKKNIQIQLPAFQLANEASKELHLVILSDERSEESKDLRISATGQIKLKIAPEKA
jgi:hypothetical protein